LFLYDKGYDWKIYPIIHIDLGNCTAQSPEELKEYLEYTINEIATENNITLTATLLSQKFENLIKEMAKDEKVVILIDEYDKPIQENATKDNINAVRQVLESFYSNIKSTEAYQRFALLTGVSKFSRVSIFSKLNNLTDLNDIPAFASALGYTQDELESYFSEFIDKVAGELSIYRNELLSELRTWYNGYKFHHKGQSVYNPVSIGKFFENEGEFKNYWFETGNPRFLLDVMKKNDYDISLNENMELTAIGFSAYDIGDIAVEPLLFQTGYITIKDYDPEFKLYTLGYPNFEVYEAFLQYLAGTFTPVRKELASPFASKLVKAINSTDIEGFFKGLKVFFAGIDYDLQIAHEKYYQTVFYVVFRMMGLHVKAEEKTNTGRIDAVIETDTHALLSNKPAFPVIYIFEFKLFDTAENALQQIKDKKYYEKYLDSGKEIMLIGASFSTETRNIDEWITEKH